ncbi:MAG: SIS domain-containing protein, partial [Candidatus Eremiobacterota bacterium]
EGSVAVVMHSTAEPDKTYLALRGSGQSMFVGIGPHGYVFASELYGVVEQTARFVRMDGTAERETGCPDTAGQVLVLDAARIHGLEGISAWSFDGQSLSLNPDDVKTAEITTRDINRGPFRHFLLKEISESPESVRKTLRGKFVLSEGQVRMNLGENVFPTALASRLRQREIRQVYLIGQGTAAVAGQAVASMMQRVLGSTASVRAMKATELSGYGLLEDMSDSLVIAISQSGTTTDTNRTVDLVKSKGASVIGIVNRRNSDLVYKVDGVLYTSDGRDIEMSVASTKAFYSQVLAGYLLAYQMGLFTASLSEEEAYRELDVLTHLPDLMKQVLAEHTPIRRLAERWAPTRRDWAVVGSGATRAAADEIRIKLSELCYKSIATDYIEDKKHIDLSSEPLTLVCAAGLPLMALKDAVKEVAIFRSHKSVPIVICSEGFDAFEPYAAGVIYVPKASENASVLLNTLVGHLWGYYCALAIDEGASQLRPARALAVRYFNGVPSALPGLGILKQVLTIGRQFQENLARGRFNSSLSVDVGARLSLIFRYFTGAEPLRQFSHEFQASPTPEAMAGTLIANLTTAINELARPIDAIKHQAKTITVGISRLEESTTGPLFDALRELKVSLEALPYRELVLLRAITPAVREVMGVTQYRVTGLGSLGETSDSTSLQVVAKLGASKNLRSRADSQYPLMGTKERVVRTRTGYVGRGGKDDRPIVILPVLPRGKVETLVLFHLAFQEAMPLARKVVMLREMQQRYDDIKSFVTETDLEWNDAYLERFSAEDLVTLPIEVLNARVLEAAREAVTAPAG